MDFNQYGYKEHQDCKPTPPINRNSYKDEEVVSIGTWIIVTILLAIPLINFIALLVLAFGDHNENLQNFAKATLLVGAIGLFIVLLLGGYSY